MSPLEIINTPTSELLERASALKTYGMRFAQCHAQHAADNRFDLTYSFVEDATGRIVSLRLNIDPQESVPSVSEIFPCAFVFENEMHDLYGVHVTGISIDFQGGFYHVHYPQPMAQAPAQPAAKAKSAASEN
ncbi:MAG: NADH-quinone oxidoreductase subunit C [Coriobacteriales bacterium]|nr:NADH-quinone oxidoreductase subunit C [Coriobacteriales bacterium]